MISCLAIYQLHIFFLTWCRMKWYLVKRSIDQGLFYIQNEDSRLGHMLATMAATQMKGRAHRACVQHWLNCFFLVFKEAINSCFLKLSRVHCDIVMCMSGNMAHKLDEAIATTTRWTGTYLCRQKKFAIALVKNLVAHELSKHIETRYHLIRH